MLGRRVLSKVSLDEKRQGPPTCWIHLLASLDFLRSRLHELLKALVIDV